MENANSTESKAVISYGEKRAIEVNVTKANKILSKYNLEFRYSKFSTEESDPLVPSLVYLNNRRIKEAQEYGVSISKEVRNDKIRFFVSEINFPIMDTEEKSEKFLSRISDAKIDCMRLNELGLYVSENLTTLH